jgi:hypothetical protein
MIKISNPEPVQLYTNSTGNEPDSMGKKALETT